MTAVAAATSPKSKLRPPPRAPAEEEVSRVVPVLNNLLGKVQISTGAGPKGAFDGGKLIHLNVGSNLVPEALWREAEKQSRVKVMLKTKIKRVGGPEDSLARIGELMLIVGETLRADNPLLDLDTDDQLAFVSNTESLDLLQQLATTKAPGQVLIAINQKIRRIQDPKNQKKKKDE